MSKEIVLLLTGGAIGLFSSIVTTIIGFFLQQRREENNRKHQREVRDEERKYKDLTAIKDLVAKDSAYLIRGEKRPSILRDTSGEFACLVSGTMISMPEGDKKQVQDLHDGDIIKSYDTRSRTIRPSRIINIASQKVEKYIVFNKKLCTSESHYIFTTNGWRRAIDIGIGMFLVREDNSAVEVTSVELVYKSVDVFGVKIETKSSLFAEGYCVSDHESKVSGIFQDGTNNYEEIVEIAEDGTISKREIK